MTFEKEARWKQLEALGATREIPTPDGEARMSAVVLQLAEPLMKKHATDLKRAKTILMLTVIAWNHSQVPPDKRALFENEWIDALGVANGTAEDRAFVSNILSSIASRRERDFPDLNNIIVDHEVVISGDSLTLNVTSAPLPKLT